LVSHDHTFAISSAGKSLSSESEAMLEDLDDSASPTPAITRGDNNQTGHRAKLTGSSDNNNTKMSFEIILPKIDNPEQYEYLPGHFTAHRVLGIDTTSNEQRLTVRMKSGELLTVSITKFCLDHIV
jgi:hypothetical protein